MKVHLLNVRLSFPNLWEAEAFEGAKPKFGADLIIQPDSKVLAVKENDVKVGVTMEKVMAAVAKVGWKDKGASVLKGLEPSKKCYRDGDTRTNSSGEIYDGYEGLMYVTAKNASRPRILDCDKTHLTEADGRPYSGCFVNAIIDVYPMTDPKRRGVFATLMGVQFVKDGDSFGGGGIASEDDFDDIGEDDAFGDDDDGLDDDDDDLT